MAKQSSIITVEGKIGNIVGMKGSNGRSYARARVTPKNPKTTQQEIQRLIFATVAKGYAKMKSICDHSFEGVQYGAKSQQEFMKQNLNKVRSWFATNYPNVVTEDYLQDVCLAEHNENRDMSGIGLIVSKGTLPGLQPTMEIEEEVPVVSFGNALADAKIATILANNNLQKGDQLTAIALVRAPGQPSEFLKSRYVINADAEDATLAATNWSETAAGECYDQTKSEVGALHIEQDSSGLMLDLAGRPENEVIIAGAIIISRKVGNQWLRSASWLYNMRDTIDEPATLLSWWLEGTAEIDTLNDRYLNNADRLGE